MGGVQPLEPQHGALGPGLVEAVVLLENRGLVLGGEGSPAGPGSRVVVGHRAIVQRLCRAVNQDSQRNGACGPGFTTTSTTRQAVATFVNAYNNEWLIQHHGHQTRREKYLASLSSDAA